MTTNDRDYYRALEDRELIDAVRYAIPTRTSWEELAIVLAERLDRANFELTGKFYDRIAEREGY